MPGRDVAVRIEGLTQYRRDLSKLDRTVSRELGKDIKKAAERTVLPLARELAPTRSGRLAASLKVGSQVSRAFIRSPLPYANAQHWGGRVGRHKATRIRATEFASRAIETRKDAVVEEIGDAFDDHARRNGWR